MSQLTLPSGRVLALNEPTWGDFIDCQLAVEQAAKEGRNTLFARLDLLRERLTALTADEYRGLSAADGDALATAMLKAIKPQRNADKEGAPDGDPLPNGQPSTST